MTSTRGGPRSSRRGGRDGARGCGWLRPASMPFGSSGWRRGRASRRMTKQATHGWSGVQGFPRGTPPTGPIPPRSAAGSASCARRGGTHRPTSTRHSTAGASGWVSAPRLLGAGRGLQRRLLPMRQHPLRANGPHPPRPRRSRGRRDGPRAAGVGGGDRLVARPADMPSLGVARRHAVAGGRWPWRRWRGQPRLLAGTGIALAGRRCGPHVRPPRPARPRGGDRWVSRAASAGTASTTPARA